MGLTLANRRDTMPKLTDTQTIILSAGAQRPDNIALPLPKGLHGAAAKMAVTKMMERGWLQEVDANLRRGEPLWRETGDGHGVTLIATNAGLTAIGIETEDVNTASASAADAATNTPTLDSPAETKAAPKAHTPRTGTKQAALIDMLSRPDGATIEEIAAALQWQVHTARGAISGALKKKLGLSITSEKEDQRGRVYRLS